MLFRCDAGSKRSARIPALRGPLELGQLLASARRGDLTPKVSRLVAVGDATALGSVTHGNCKGGVHPARVQVTTMSQKPIVFPAPLQGAHLFFAQLPEVTWPKAAPSPPAIDLGAFGAKAGRQASGLPRSGRNR